MAGVFSLFDEEILAEWRRAITGADKDMETLRQARHPHRDWGFGFSFLLSMSMASATINEALTLAAEKHRNAILDDALIIIKEAQDAAKEKLARLTTEA